MSTTFRSSMPSSTVMVSPEIDTLAPRSRVIFATAFDLLDANAFRSSVILTFMSQTPCITIAQANLARFTPMSVPPPGQHGIALRLAEVSQRPTYATQVRLHRRKRLGVDGGGGVVVEVNGSHPAIL